MTDYTRHNPDIGALQLLCAVVAGIPDEQLDVFVNQTTALHVARAALSYLTPETWLTTTGSGDVENRLRATLASVLDAELDED